VVASSPETRSTVAAIEGVPVKTKFITAAALAFALPLALLSAAPSTAAPAATASVLVKGHVRSPSGKAVPGVQVSVYSTISGHHVVRRATTSRTGRYAIRIAESEWSYQLKVLDHGDADRDDGDGRWAPVLRRFDFSGRSKTIDQVVHHGARLTGRVYGRTGKPVGAGVVVGVGLDRSSQPGAETITRADGTYRITNAPAGASVVAFKSPRAGESTRWYSSSSILGTTDGTRSTVVAMRYSRTVTGVDLRFPYLGSISGIVTVDGDHPSEEGSPVEAALLDAEGTELYSELVNPEFRMRDLLPGRYYIEFRAGTPEDALVTEYYEDSATLAGATPLVIGPKGGTITGLEVALSSGQGGAGGAN